MGKKLGILDESKSEPTVAGSGGKDVKTEMSADGKPKKRAFNMDVLKSFSQRILNRGKASANATEKVAASVAASAVEDEKAAREQKQQPPSLDTTTTTTKSRPQSTQAPLVTAAAAVAPRPQSAQPPLITSAARTQAAPAPAVRQPQQSLPHSGLAPSLASRRVLSQASSAKRATQKRS